MRSSSSACRMNLYSQRGSPSIYRMRRGSDPTFTTRVNVLLAVFSSPGSGAAAICSVLAPGAADIEHQSFGLEIAVRPQGDGAGGQHLRLGRC